MQWDSLMQKSEDEHVLAKLAEKVDVKLIQSPRNNTCWAGADGALDEIACSVRDVEPQKEVFSLLSRHCARIYDCCCADILLFGRTKAEGSTLGVTLREH